MKKKYDIFISYRRDDGAQYARILQLELQKRGYHVFLDYDELTDGIFGDKIRNAIEEASIFIAILSPHYLDRCINEHDWVRCELLLAIKLNKHFIPIDPDNKFAGIPAGIPDEIGEFVGSHQQSGISFGQFMDACIDMMIKNRLASVIGTPTSKKSWMKRITDIFIKNKRKEKLIEDYLPQDVEYDIFISYRRIDGRDVARNIQQALKARGFKNIFFDYDSIQKGEFNKRIIDAIYSCTDFILVLSPKSMKRCTKNGDPVSNEIRTAVKYNKNIIPVTIDGKEVNWPRSFPDDLCFLKGLQFHDHKSDSYFEHSIDELCEKLSLRKHSVESHTECISSSFMVQDQTEIIRENSNKDFDFCLCYSKQNLSDIGIIYSLFENVGCKCWTIDNALKDAGRSAQESIGEGIDKSRYFLFFHSEYTNKSHLAIAELQYAIDYGAKILSIKLDQAAYSYELKTLLGTYQTIELSEVGDFEKLVASIKEMAV